MYKVTIILLIALGFFIFSHHTIEASETIWIQPSTTDCSFQGGTNGDFSNICFNTLGTNSSVVWNLTSETKPAISIPVITGHHYIFSYTTPFSYGTTSGHDDIMINYFTDGTNQYILGSRSDWLYANDGYRDGILYYPFIATSNTLYFLWGGGCDSSTGCVAQDLRLVDLDINNPTSTPTATPSQTIVPTPTPTETPTSTPSPSTTPTPVTKIIFIPGMGATWNVDAFMSCKGSGYSGEWTLAPYAKGVYQNFLTLLPESGWNITPFYYDWRQDIRDNSTLLGNVLEGVRSEGEKVNLVGHSMGGLVARNYIEQMSGEGIAKLLMVGTPNKGSLLAYPLVHGEIWTNDLVEKIAASLFVKHCGIPKSAQNVLPTFNYLRNAKTRQTIDITQMKTKNNYLPTDFVSPFWGVKVGTLAGTGQPTLKTINVVPGTGWSDGRPVSKQSVKQGDGSVLTESAQIEGAFSNEVINQTHSGIIGTTEGTNKILEFLGSQGVDDPPFVEPRSALILVGHPAAFYLTDRKGNTTASENGMIAVINPKSEDYQLQIVPGSDTTNFIVAQFLPTGNTFYKEYKFTGLSIEPKIVEFNTRQTREHILHSVSEHNKPNFPRYWYLVWKFWNKYHK
jgi:pimeloyl-ACP methyl ester carboxylesterase